MSGCWDWHPDPVRREIRALEAMKTQLLVNLTDCSYECEHGALPLDRSKPLGCVCWTPAMTDALARRVQENPDYSDAA